MHRSKWQLSNETYSRVSTYLYFKIIIKLYNLLSLYINCKKDIREYHLDVLEHWHTPPQLPRLLTWEQQLWQLVLLPVERRKTPLQQQLLAFRSDLLKAKQYTFNNHSSIHYEVDILQYIKIARCFNQSHASSFKYQWREFEQIEMFADKTTVK